MSGFEDREKAQQGQYAHQEKMNFNTEARASKLFGLWAADHLGLSGADANTYAMEVVEANLDEPGMDDVLRKVRADFDKKGLDISDHLMDVELAKAVEEAKKQLSSGS